MKGQVNAQVFTVIMVVVVVGAALIAGMSLSQTATETNEEVVRAQLKNELERTMEDLSYGSTTLEEIELPPEYDEVCFSGTLDPESLPPAFRERYPRIAQEIATGQNVFIIDDQGYHVSFRLDRLSVEDRIVCVRTADGTLDLLLEGKGTSIDVDAADPEDTGITVPSGTTGNRYVVHAPDFGAELEIPPNVQVVYQGGPEPQDIIVKQAEDQTVEDPNISPVSSVYEFSPSGTQFGGEGVTMTLCLNQDLPDFTPADLAALKLYYRDPSGNWRPVDSTMCPGISYTPINERCVEVSGICHFTAFVLAGEGTMCNSNICYIPPVSECTDSDEGGDKYTAGTVKGKLENGRYGAVKDACHGPNTLNEFICTENTVTAATVHCPEGCSAGRCLRSQAERDCTYRAPGAVRPGAAQYCFFNADGWEHLPGRPKTACYYYGDTDSSDYPENICGTKYDCTPGETAETLVADGSKSYTEVCITPRGDYTEEPPSGCTDTDGDNVAFRGRVIGTWENGEAATVRDSCLDANTLNEYVCKDGHVAAETVPCAQGCSEGRCLGQGGQNVCVDSDGFNYFSTGTVRYTPPTDEQPTTCGDGVVQPPEECDGNNVPGGRCTEYCTVACDNETHTYDGEACTDPCESTVQVCASNRRVYENACRAREAGQTVVCTGACPCELPTAGAFLDRLDALGAECDSLADWNPDRQRWEQYDGTGTPFPLESGTGYLLTCTRLPRLTMTGNPQTTTTLQLVEGKNIISLPRDAPVSTLMQRLRYQAPSCSKVETLIDGTWKELGGDATLESGTGYRLTCEQGGNAVVYVGYTRAAPLTPGETTAQVIALPFSGALQLSSSADCGNGIVERTEECDPQAPLGELATVARCTQGCTIECLAPDAWYNPLTNTCSDAAACPDDTRVCPDGTTVSRTGPDCTFAPCPSAGQVMRDSCLNTDVVQEYVCDGGVPSKRTHACPYGCLQGRCAEAPSSGEAERCRAAGGTWRSFASTCADYCWAQEGAESLPPGTEGAENTVGGAVFTGYAVGSAELDNSLDPGGEQCTTIYDPVCGVDGETYSNACYARNAGATVACEGECPCSTLGVGTADELLEALNRLGADCDSLARWTGYSWEQYTQAVGTDFPLEAGDGYVLRCGQQRRVQLEGDALSSVQLSLRPGNNVISLPFETLTAASLRAELEAQGVACDQVYTYTNGEWVLYEGTLAPDRGYMLRCRQRGTATLEGAGIETLDLTTGNAALGMPFAREMSLEPYEEPVACTAQYAPVCGVDGETYSNACYARNEGVSVACEGECPCTTCQNIVTESCDCGPSACWTGEACVAALDEAGCGNSRCEFGEKDICPGDCGPNSNCPLPYHVMTADDRCVWSCGEGTTPDRVSYECVCKEGFVETGRDQFGRRVCTAPTSASCGDGVCSSGESAASCPRDCCSAEGEWCAGPNGDLPCCDGLVCEQEPGTVDSFCMPPSSGNTTSCGDGVVQPPEECDMGLLTVEPENGHCDNCMLICDDGFTKRNGECVPVECISDADCPTDTACLVGSCQEGACVYDPVPPTCPPPEQTTCGEPLQSRYGCGDCDGLGTWCPAGYVCDLSGISPNCVQQ